MEVRFAKPQDLDGWMTLVERVRDVFPGLETAEALAAHRETVLQFVENSSAICVSESGQVTGALLFSKDSGVLNFLAVDPDHRRQHIAKKMVSWMLSQMEEGQNVTVTTYREGDPNGIAARAFYRSLGFSQGKLTEEFGCPVQEFVLKRQVPR